MSFENLTMAPIEKDLINRERLNKMKKDGLIIITALFFNNLRSSMNKIEVIELKKACSAI